uniref:ATPase AAA-type core domain-containing protein n=1 Tax=Setaria digitata TaxID=48799 RepID=A0A915Q3H2_9BILA
MIKDGFRILSADQGSISDGQCETIRNEFPKKRAKLLFLDEIHATKRICTSEFDGRDPDSDPRLPV